MVISTMWLLVVFIGGFALLGAIIWARMNNRVTRDQHRRTEQATRELYENGTTDESSLNR